MLLLLRLLKVRGKTSIDIAHDLGTADAPAERRRWQEENFLQQELNANIVIRLDSAVPLLFWYAMLVQLRGLDNIFKCLLCLLQATRLRRPSLPRRI